MDVRLKPLNKNDTKELRYLCCVRYHLENCEILEKYSDDELALVFNGIGPDAFPSAITSLLDALHPSLLPVALIHDVEFNESDATVPSFEAANDRFLRNGCKVAKLKFAWYNPRRYTVMFDAWRYAKTCDLFGWSAWMSATTEIQLITKREENEMDDKITTPQDALEWLLNDIYEEASVDGEMSTQNAIRAGFISDMLKRFPRRNCDVGTAQEQDDRFEKFCDEHKYVGDHGANACSEKCPFYKSLNCALWWAQLPYESEVTDND